MLQNRFDGVRVSYTNVFGSTSRWLRSHPSESGAVRADTEHLFPAFNVSLHPFLSTLKVAATACSPSIRQASPEMMVLIFSDACNGS